MGYFWSEKSESCEDIDECLDGGIGQSTCNSVGMAYTCQNLIGAYTCVCNSGYSFDPDTNECHDINECLEGTSGCEIGCTNLEGSFECTSPTTSPTTSFIPTCQLDCSGVACIVVCNCQNGYTWDQAASKCVDIDECATGADICYAEPICENTVGSFNCGCDAGFTQGKISTI